MGNFKIYFATGLALIAEVGIRCPTFAAESGTALNIPAGTGLLVGASACTNQGKIIAGTNKPKQQLNTNRSNRFIPAEIKF